MSPGQFLKAAKALFDNGVKPPRILVLNLGYWAWNRYYLVEIWLDFSAMIVQLNTVTPEF